MPETTPGEVIKDVVLVNMRGLHARASAKLCAEVGKWQSEISVEKDGYRVGGCSIMGLLTLGAGCGSTVRLIAKGMDAKEAVESLANLINDRFGEPE